VELEERDRDGAQRDADRDPDPLLVGTHEVGDQERRRQRELRQDGARPDVP
jgi:hypothetical protein